MAALADIRAGIAGNLATLKGVQVSAYVLAKPTLPTIWVRPDPSGSLIEYHQAMRDGLEHWHMLIEAYTGTISDVGAQKKLDELVESSGVTSVKAALESDKTLAGKAQDLMVETAHGYGEYARADGSAVLGAKWSVIVYMNGG